MSEHLTTAGVLAQLCFFVGLCMSILTGDGSMMQSGITTGLKVGAAYAAFAALCLMFQRVDRGLNDE